MQAGAEKETMASEFVELPWGYRAYLHTAEECLALPRGGLNDPLIETADWCEHFLGRPSSLVGRSGNVCPFVPESMMRGSLKLAVIPFSKPGEEAIPELEATVIAFREYFLASEKRQGKIDIFGSYIMVFPDVVGEDAVNIVDPPQRRLKPTFVKEGLMLGEFHPFSMSPGLRNAAFRPLRSPIPMLVIRHMVESDIDFLSRPFDPPAIRIQSLKAYLQFLGSSMSLASQAKAKEALQVAEADAAAASSQA